MNAALGLGSDVTILVGGADGLKATTDAANFAQNKKKIEEVTGLKVGDGIDENGNTPAGTKGGADTDEGIRLTLSNKKIEGNGLTLQIGDTSDSFNQMKVNVGDMQVDAMGKGKTTLDGKEINATKTIS